jgi:lipid-A-disaccharide synthase
LGGPPCTYVGHPLVEQVDELRPNATEAEQRVSGTPLLLVLPGSRKNEIRRLIEPFGRTIERIAKTVWPLDLVIPTTPHLQDLVLRETARWPLRPKIVVKREDRRLAFRSARAALAKSGTVTLELGVAGVPMVTAYKMAPWEIAIARRLIRVPSVILTNLVLGENVVPEFIQTECTPEKLSAALAPLLSDSPERQKQVAAFARLDGLMEIGVARPAARAAAIVEDVASLSCGGLEIRFILAAPPSSGFPNQTTLES